MTSRKLAAKKLKRGQSSVEYLMIIAVIVVVIGVFGKAMREKIKGVTDSVFGGVDSNIKSLTNPQ